MKNEKCKVQNVSDSTRRVISRVCPFFIFHFAFFTLHFRSQTKFSKRNQPSRRKGQPNKNGRKVPVAWPSSYRSDLNASAHKCAYPEIPLSWDSAIPG
jgi:hypothetical protein